MTEPLRTDRYFVDEAGDLACFDRRGRIIVGTEGVSKCFIVGAALIPDPVGLASRLEDLRSRLLADRYFAGVPSMQPQGGKTARLFHAKDDVPEVRREVFAILQDADIELYAAFRRKRVLAEQLRAHQERTGRKLDAEFVYEELVVSVFQNRLHLANEHHILFARRGKADRNIALTKAIELAKSRFESKWRKGIDRPVTVASTTPSESAGLQATDYYLWALQRLLERGETRYFKLLGRAFRVIHDRDDTRTKPYGEFYTASSNPLEEQKLMPVI